MNVRVEAFRRTNVPDNRTTSNAPHKRVNATHTKPSPTQHSMVLLQLKGKNDKEQVLAEIPAATSNDDVCRTLARLWNDRLRLIRLCSVASLCVCWSVLSGAEREAKIS